MDPHMTKRLLSPLAAAVFALLPGALLNSRAVSTAAIPQVVGETPVPSLAPMIKRISPAVVNIGTRGTVRDSGASNPLLEDPFFRRFFDVPPDSGPRERPFQSAGSGVIFDAAKGYIVTNAHVVENANEITVTLQDGRDLKAEVVGSDQPSDVAVLKVSPANLSQITLGDSQRVEVGDFVVAIGNPFGLSHTVTSGIISGLDRSGINPDGFENFIQTDASINPGNSGGALVNLRGELIGINSAILSRSGGNIGIGFAIPVNMARNVMDQLIRFGSVKRGLLGVTIRPITPDIAQALGLGQANGALVMQVVPGSSAEKAGLRAGDVVTAINKQTVKSHNELRNAIGMLRVGEKVDIGVLRDGKALRLVATIADTGTADATTASRATAGPRETATIHRGLDGATLADAANDGGVIVRAVEAGSAAAGFGLRANDIIIGANRARVTTVKQLRDAAVGAGSLVLNVRRGNTIVLIPLR